MIVVTNGRPLLVEDQAEVEGVTTRLARVLDQDSPELRPLLLRPDYMPAGVARSQEQALANDNQHTRYIKHPDGSYEAVEPDPNYPGRRL